MARQTRPTGNRKPARTKVARDCAIREARSEDVQVSILLRSRELSVPSEVLGLIVCVLRLIVSGLMDGVRLRKLIEGIRNGRPVVAYGRRHRE